MMLTSSLPAMQLVPNQDTLSVAGLAGSAILTVATNNVGRTNWAAVLTTNVLTATWAGVVTVTNTYVITNQAAWSAPTNAGVRTVSLTVPLQDFTTNAGFSFAGFTGVTITDYRSSGVLVTNSSGSTFIISRAGKLPYFRDGELHECDGVLVFLQCGAVDEYGGAAAVVGVG